MKSMLTHEGLELVTSLSLVLMSGLCHCCGTQKSQKKVIPHINENGCKNMSTVLE